MSQRLRLLRREYRLLLELQDGDERAAPPGVGIQTVLDALNAGWVVRCDDKRKLQITQQGKAALQNGKKPAP